MFLIDNGADPNRMDFLGRTPLHVAAADDYPDMVKLLIDSGGTVNPVLRGHSKRTPKIVFQNLLPRNACQKYSRMLFWSILQCF